MRLDLTDVRYRISGDAGWVGESLGKHHDDRVVGHIGITGLIDLLRLFRIFLCDCLHGFL